MKLKSLIMFSAAALAFAACSNEEDVNATQPTGNTTVSVKLNLPKILTDATRTGSGIPASGETTGTTGETTPVVFKTGQIILHAGQGGPTPQTLELTAEDVTDILNGTYTFTNVIAPSSVEVIINGGNSEKLTIDEANTAGLATPLWAEVTTADTDASDGNGFVWNAETNQYDVTVTPAPRYARLELSNISHGADGADGCIFKAAQFKGLYLNDIYTTEGGTALASAEGAGAWASLATDAYAAPTWSPATGDFMAENAVWPSEEGQCYAYSVFEGKLPIVVFAVDKVTLADNYIIKGWNGGEDDCLYAAVGKFVTSEKIEEEDRAKYGVGPDGETIETFKAGNIYKITDIAIPDVAWQPAPYDPGQQTKYTVVATVKVLPWTIVEGSVEW